MTTPPTISRTTELSDSTYKWGFTTDVDTDMAPKGINEDIVRLISAKKDEPEWLLEWRLKAFAHWKKLAAEEGQPRWARIDYPEIDYQDMYYYAAPVTAEGPKSLDEVAVRYRRLHQRRLRMRPRLPPSVWSRVDPRLPERSAWIGLGNAIR